MVAWFNYSLACGKLRVMQFSFYWRAVDAIDREMAVGNTFGATALSSYGGFWISFAIVFTPGGFQVLPTYEQMLGSESAGASEFYTVFSFYLFVSVAYFLLCAELT